MSTTKTKGRLWTRDELIIAMNLYCKLPFGLLHARNPDVIALAGLLDRTPGSVAMKLCNLASHDPVHQARGVSGLSGGSAMDREVWNQFESDWDSLAFESEKLLADRRGIRIEESADILEAELPRTGKERERMVKQRVNQSFFRSAVLAAYEGRCCLTGIAMPELLIASHVVPWAVNEAARVNPRNGLCLNAFHDRAFDRGLITLSDDLTVQVSPRLLRAKADEISQHWLLRYNREPIRLPHRYRPELEFVRWHRENCFQAA